MKRFNQKSSFGKKNFNRREKPGATGTGRGNFGGKISRDAHGFGQEKRMHRAVCTECGTDCEVPFKPNGERPVLCSNCFGEMAAAESPRRDQFKPKRFARPNRPGSFRRSERTDPRNSDDLKKELAQIHQKLDLILSVLKRG
jgi:CxxC-x17-CxxC domain-containing protein